MKSINPHPLYAPHITYVFDANNARGRQDGSADTKTEAIKKYKHYKREGYQMSDGIYKEEIHYKDDATQDQSKYKRELVWKP